MPKRPVLFSLIAAALVVGVIQINENSNNDTPVATANETTTVTTPETTTSTETNASTETTESSDTTAQTATDDKSEAATTTPNVETTPVIYTGYGHNEAKPLPNGQATSTSCTTDANVECELIFTNKDTDESFTATITTNNQGVGLYQWTGGQDITTGTWIVMAIAGNKTSETETIYVQ